MKILSQPKKGFKKGFLIAFILFVVSLAIIAATNFEIDTSSNSIVTVIFSWIVFYAWIFAVRILEMIGIVGGTSCPSAATFSTFAIELTGEGFQLTSCAKIPILITQALIISFIGGILGAIFYRK
jgi:hypothetical protein